jgi:hypothetical protein
MNFFTNISSEIAGGIFYAEKQNKIVLFNNTISSGDLEIMNVVFFLESNNNFLLNQNIFNLQSLL